MDFKQLATTILANVGGKENVDKVVHCATRLRFTLKDDTKAQTEVLKKTQGVLSVINAGGQYQVVIGPDVPAVYQEVVALGGLYLGITGVARYASGSPGLLVLPAYVGGESMTNFFNACIGTVIAMVVSFVVCFVLYSVWAKQGKLDPSETEGN